MFGRNFLYIFVRENGILFKLGVTSDINGRFNRLNKKYGPFSLNKTIFLRTDSLNEAKSLEKSLQNTFSDFNCPIPTRSSRDGETEWYAETCCQDMKDWLKLLASRRHGEGHHVAKIDAASTFRTNKNDKKNQELFQKILEKRIPTIKTLHENSENIRDFRKTIKYAEPFIIGMSSRGEKYSPNRCYELFLAADTDQKILEALFNSARLKADNDKVWAGLNICTSTESTNKFKRATFSIPDDFKSLEISWESQGKLSKFSSLLEDLESAFPLPPAYKDYVGESLLDRHPDIIEPLLNAIMNTPEKDGTEDNGNTRA